MIARYRSIDGEILISLKVIQTVRLIELPVFIHAIFLANDVEVSDILDNVVIHYLSPKLGAVH